MFRNVSLRAIQRRWMNSTFAMAIIALLFSQSLVAQPYLAPRQPGYHSTLVGSDGRQIVDDVFAGWIKNALVPNANVNVKDAKFFFQECFGGGMLDALRTQLGDQVDWVGGAASRWDQVAYGTDDGEDATWMQALRPELLREQSLYTSLNIARARDVLGVNGLRMEEGQSFFGKQGDKITLKDPNAQSHHAILFVGDTRFPGNAFRNVISDFNYRLQTAWANSDYEVNILFGNGLTDTLGMPLPANWNAQAGTGENLRRTIEMVATKLNPNEQFLFFGFNHGGQIVPVRTERCRIPQGSIGLDAFGVDQDVLRALRNTEGALPKLTITYTDLLGPVEVTLNNQLLGELNTQATEIEFLIPLDILSETNIVQIANLGSANDFVCNSIDFWTGPVAIQTVPEPSNAVLLMIYASGLVSIIRIRRIRTR